MTVHGQTSVPPPRQSCSGIFFSPHRSTDRIQCGLGLVKIKVSMQAEQLFCATAGREAARGTGPFSSPEHHMSAPAWNTLISPAPASKLATAMLALMCTCQEGEETTRRSDKRASACNRAAVIQRGPHTHTHLYLHTHTLSLFKTF